MELFCKGSIFHRTIEKLSSLDNFLLRILFISLTQLSPQWALGKWAVSKYRHFYIEKYKLGPVAS